jgi:hypothetical protein
MANWSHRPMARRFSFASPKSVIQAGWHTANDATHRWEWLRPTGTAPARYSLETTAPAWIERRRGRKAKHSIRGSFRQRRCGPSLRQPCHWTAGQLQSLPQAQWRRLLRERLAAFAGRASPRQHRGPSASQRSFRNRRHVRGCCSLLAAILCRRGNYPPPWFRCCLRNTAGETVVPAGAAMRRDDSRCHVKQPLHPFYSSPAPA